MALAAVLTSEHRHNYRCIGNGCSRFGTFCAYAETQIVTSIMFAVSFVALLLARRQRIEHGVWSWVFLVVMTVGESFMIAGINASLTYPKEILMVVGVIMLVFWSMTFTLWRHYDDYDGLAASCLKGVIITVAIQLIVFLSLWLSGYCGFRWVWGGMIGVFYLTASTYYDMLYILPQKKLSESEWMLAALLIYFSTIRCADSLITYIAAFTVTKLRFICCCCNDKAE